MKIFLRDKRSYSSVIGTMGRQNFFLYCMLHGYKFIVRAKSYTYKDYVCGIESDGEISVPFNRGLVSKAEER